MTSRHRSRAIAYDRDGAHRATVPTERETVMIAFGDGLPWLPVPVRSSTRHFAVHRKLEALTGWTVTMKLNGFAASEHIRLLADAVRYAGQVEGLYAKSGYPMPPKPQDMKMPQRQSRAWRKFVGGLRSTSRRYRVRGLYIHGPARG